tara:strand:+ start:824 stop:1234 length:411 start_codon:yes stop_codon:yes gene_type:complete
MSSQVRGLKVKKNPLDKILGKNKTWEIRSTDTKFRGDIFLLQTKDNTATSGLVRGKAKIVKTIFLGTSDKPDELNARLYETQSFHCMDKEDFQRTLKYRYVYAYVLEEVTVMTPLEYENPNGAVKWVRNVVLRGVT